MILSDFLLLDDTGLYCEAGNFYIDPQQPVSNAIISHAHGDHAVRGNSTVYCTAATARIMELRYKKNAAEYFRIHPFNQPFEVGEVKKGRTFRG